MQTSGLKQTRDGQQYMQLRDETTEEIRELLIDTQAADTPFDLRGSNGHLWQWRKGTYLPQPCGSSNCKVCRGQA